MKLRLRLGLTVIAAAIPIVITLGWFQRYVAGNAIRDVLVQTALGTMTDDERQRCEASPGTWQGDRAFRPRFENERPPFGPPGRPPPGIRLPGDGPPEGRRGAPPPPPPPPRFAKVYAYDAAGFSQNPEAPPLDAESREAIAAGRSVFSQRKDMGGQDEIQVLARLPATGGACSYLLLRQPAPPGAQRPWFMPLVPVLVMLGAVWVALGPVIRRVRKLAAEVRASAPEHYNKPITVQGNDEIAELAQAFQEAGNQINTYIAEQALREKALRDFVANTTHDVMLPLSVLHGQLAAIREFVTEGKPVDGATVGAAIKEAHYMGALVRNLTAAAKLESGTPELQRVPANLGEIVERVAGRHATVAREHKVTLEHAEPETPVWVTCDMTLVEQAINNIVYNAVLYNKPGGHVAILLTSKTGGSFLLRVIDDGPGVPEDELAKLAKRHYRSDAARSRNPGGSGLGLTIAHRISELHGWSLTLGRSEYGGLEVALSV